MKKISLIMLFIVLCSGKVFAGFAIGANVYANFTDFTSVHHVTDWGFGGSLGLGGMKGRPLFVEVTGNSFNDHNAQVRVNVDWHFLPLNLFVFQIFFGLGAGTTMNFDPHDMHNSMNAIVAARLPIGVKLFLKDIEIFVSVAPQVGYNITPGTFYWSIDTSTGLRVWF